MGTGQSSSFITPVAVLVAAAAGASGGGLLAGAIGASLGGVLGVVVGLVVGGSMSQSGQAGVARETNSSRGDRQSEAAAVEETEEAESEEALQDIVDDVNEIGVDGAPERNNKARNLEREAKEKRDEGNEEEADALIEEAKELYRENVEKGFVGTAPYRRLAIIYRRKKDYESEIAISEKALEVADLTEKQREYFEHRIERANELK